jgi:uncharacterized protein
VDDTTNATADSSSRDADHGRSSAAPVAWIVAAALVAAAMLLGLRAVGDGIAQRGDEQGVTVTGSAREDVRSDRAVWTIAANDQAPDPASAIARTNAAIETVVDYLVSNGIAESEISLGGLSTSINNVYIDGNWTADVASYSAFRDLTVRTDQVDLVDRLSRGIGAILESGISVSSYAPEYYVTLLPELRPRMLEAAVSDALARADAMVGVVGGEVRGVRTVRSGPFQVSAPDSVDVSDYGMYDTRTIDKTVTATVTVTFAVVAD